MTINLSYVERIRSFNRFYTQILGLLNNKLLKSNYSLAEARILFELGQTSNLVSRDLSKQLHLDPAYLSRLLMRFETQGLLHKKKIPERHSQTDSFSHITRQIRNCQAPVNVKSPDYIITYQYDQRGA